MKLKNTPSVFLLFLLLNLTANAQQILHFKHACSFDGDREDAEIYADDPSDEAATIVRNIMKMNILPQNFIIKSGNVKNALASVEGKQRYILYSTSFLESFKANDNAKWAAYCLMAHEIGHHLSNHDMEETDPSRCRLREIQADKFAGGILFRMGATLLQAQAGINYYTSEVGSKTHPPKSARLEAVASGWKQMQENMRAGGFEQPEPTPIEPQNTQKKIKQSKKVTLLPPSVLFNDMVKVKGGTFEMGSNDGRFNEIPVHSITVSDFSIGKYEVTQQLWFDVMATKPSEFENCNECPVENVSWDDVQDFLKKINKMTGKDYRLPTEEEWEYTARGGDKSNGFIYSGDKLLGKVAWYGGNSANQTQKVGTKHANELGIFDMSGNVREWCQDGFNLYSKRSGVTEGVNRMIRGGSWDDDTEGCRSTYRDDNRRTYRGNHIGFRLAMSSL